MIRAKTGPSKWGKLIYDRSDESVKMLPVRCILCWPNLAESASGELLDELGSRTAFSRPGLICYIIKNNYIN